MSSIIAWICWHFKLLNLKSICPLEAAISPDNARKNWRDRLIEKQNRKQNEQSKNTREKRPAGKSQTTMCANLVAISCRVLEDCQVSRKSSVTRVMQFELELCNWSRSSWSAWLTQFYSGAFLSVTQLAMLSQDLSHLSWQVLQLNCSRWQISRLVVKLFFMSATSDEPRNLWEYNLRREIEAN